MKLSFIICTRDRAALICGTLDSILFALENCPQVQAEIIIVDNGSRDNTSAIIDKWVNASALRPNKIVNLYNSAPGVSSSRNLALKYSTGDVIVFTDDDCLISENYVQDLLKHYSFDACPTIRGGRVELGSDKDLNFTTKTDEQSSRLAYPVHPGGFVHGCNLTCSRAVIDGIGGFDAAFGPGAVFRAAEDTDFIYRGWSAGIPVEYVPDMGVRHLHGRRDTRAIARLHWNYQFGNGALYAKHIGKNPKLIKHLYWSARNAIKETLGGPRFNESLGLTWASITAANINGIMGYYLRSAQMLLRGA